MVKLSYYFFLNIKDFRGVKNQDQIEKAEKENVNVLSLMEFSELMKWGILMGVSLIVFVEECYYLKK